MKPETVCTLAGPDRSPRRVGGHAGAFGMAQLVAHDVRTAVVDRWRPGQGDLAFARYRGEVARGGRRTARGRAGLRGRSYAGRGLAVDRAHLEDALHATGEAREPNDTAPGKRVVEQRHGAGEPMNQAEMAGRLAARTGLLFGVGVQRRSAC